MWCKEIISRRWAYLQPIKFEQFLLVFWDVTHHNVELHLPIPFDFVQDVHGSWDVNPMMSMFLVAIRVARYLWLIFLLRLCCQQSQNLASPLDSRPAPNRVFLPVENLFHPYHKYQRLSESGAAVVAAFPHFPKAPTIIFSSNPFDWVLYLLLPSFLLPHTHTSYRYSSSSLLFTFVLTPVLSTLPYSIALLP